MDIYTFIQICKKHNFNYRSNPKDYYSYKDTERLLIQQIKLNPEWADIYFSYKKGVDSFQDVA